MKPEPKLRYSECPHVYKGEGCTIYENRPQSCREFRCFWLMWSQRDDYPDLPSARPDKCGIMLSYSGAAIWIAHVEKGVNWQVGPARTLINHLLDEGFKIVISGEDLTHKTLLRKVGGDLVREAIKLSDPDTDGFQERVS